MKSTITKPEQAGQQPRPGVTKRFLRGLGFVVFGGPLILMGLYLGWGGLEEGTALVVLVSVLWIATGLAFGRHAASGFARRSPLTAGIAVVTAAVTIQVVTHLQKRGSRSLAELLGGAYMFFFLVWAVVAVPLAISRGLRRLWKSKWSPPQSKIPNAGLPPSDEA